MAFSVGCCSSIRLSIGSIVTLLRCITGRFCFGGRDSGYWAVLGKQVSAMIKTDICKLIWMQCFSDFFFYKSNFLYWWLWTNVSIVCSDDFWMEFITSHVYILSRNNVPNAFTTYRLPYVIAWCSELQQCSFSELYHADKMRKVATRHLIRLQPTLISIVTARWDILRPQALN